MRFSYSLLFVLFALIALPTKAFSQTIVYDVSADWSDTQNPNGVWTYTGNGLAPLTINQSNWGAFGIGNAWAASTFPNPGHVPMWFRGGLTSGVGMHGSEGFTSAWVGVIWESPEDGKIDIDGSVRQILTTTDDGFGGNHLVRNSNWRLRLNNTTLASGNVSGTQTFDTLLSGALSSLSQIDVVVGDKIVLEFISPTSFATFNAVDLKITATTLSPCKPQDANFYHRNIHINPPQGSGQTSIPKLRAFFVPDNGCTPNQVAAAEGYDHYNWLNIVVEAPFTLMLSCKPDFKLPFFDPLPGDSSNCSDQWDDIYHYYWNEINEDGTLTNNEVDRATGPISANFSDTPWWRTLNPYNRIKFITVLVGVKARATNNYDALSSFKWATTFNGTAGGVRPFKNLEDPDPGSGVGGIEIIDAGLSIEELPLGVRRFLASEGVSNVPLPDAIDSDGDGWTDDVDLCPDSFDLSQIDTDGDFVGDNCDNCPETPNSEQGDADFDGVGDACEDTDEDGVESESDRCSSSDLSEFVSIGACSTSVSNQIQFNGCSFADEIDQCFAHQARRKHKVSKCIRRLIRDWSIFDLISKSEKRSLRKCVPNDDDDGDDGDDDDDDDDGTQEGNDEKEGNQDDY